jgi:hypothetical protein
MCLARITELKHAEEISELLSDLYDLRSKVVHGTDSAKEYKKVVPNAAKLRLAARTVLTAYVLYMTEHTKEEWKNMRARRTSMFQEPRGLFTQK